MARQLQTYPVIFCLTLVWDIFPVSSDSMTLTRSMAPVNSNGITWFRSLAPANSNGKAWFRSLAPVNSNGKAGFRSLAPAKTTSKALQRTPVPVSTSIGRTNDCLNGYYTPGSVTCVCKEGWAGHQCEQLCPEDCVIPGRCKTTPQGMPYCSCGAGLTYVLGSGCISDSSTDILTPRQNRTIDFKGWLTKYSATGPRSSRSVRQSVNASSSSSTTSSTWQSLQSLRPLWERRCVPGFECQHGYCAPGSPFNIKCVCDDKWVGQFCQNLCNKSCSPFGRCSVHINGTVYCQCEETHTGEFCKIRRQFVGKVLHDKITLSSPQILTLPPPWVGAMQPLKRKQCLPGFVCVYGYCSNETIACICDKGYIGLFCEQHCPLECVHGTCMVLPNKTAFCSCEVNYTGVTCTEARSLLTDDENPTWPWHLVGACAGSLLTLILVLGVLPYVLWKRGNIFFMKIVYHFRSYEDNDNKLYDAFVSFKSSGVDEHFVVTHLIRRLEEEMNFRLCLHFRDFEPGETNAHNIMRAMENSCRTILILTPDYIKSEFCRFEYLRAQLEMLRQKHRIIPIILSNIAREMDQLDETLRTILQSITYLSWPEDDDSKEVGKFWKRLELSMPKKKRSKIEPSPSTSL